MKYPISSITNLAYVVVGVYSGGLLGAAFILLGVASFIYHASDLRPTQTGQPTVAWAQLADWVGMWLVFWLLIWMRIASPVEAGVISVVLTGFMILQPSKFHPYGTVPLLFLALTALQWVQGGSMLYLAAFVPSAAIWKYGRYLASERWHEDILHGIWHIGTAIGFWLLV